MRSRIRKISGITSALILAVILSGCATPEVTSGIHDPYEARNRRMHETNKNIDENVFGGGSGGESKIPRGLLVGVSNFATNWQLPNVVLNNLLQLNIEDAAHNTVRFLVNTTIGIGGVFDPALAGGVPARPSDFGETLHVWGAGEGAYVELPVLGPSTTRDTVGFAVDVVMNPVYLLLPVGSWYVPIVANIAGRAADRVRYSSSVDSVLHNSADSYAQARLLYLENRRFQLGGEETTNEDLYDIYEEDYE